MLSESQVEHLFNEVKAFPGFRLVVDLEQQRIAQERQARLSQVYTEQQRIAAAQLAQTLRLDPTVDLVAQDAELAQATWKLDKRVTGLRRVTLALNAAVGLVPRHPARARPGAAGQMPPSGARGAAGPQGIS